MANNKNIDKKSVNLLPTYFRTDKNAKFLSSTIDQLIKSPILERIDGFVGSKLSKNYNYENDVYISESLPLRQKYQLEPALILKELDGAIKKAFGFDDLINQISYYGGNSTNLDQLFRPKFNSYDPHIDWDKFVNFREYYWLPNGPNLIYISGLQKNTVSTYTVTDSPDGPFLVFTPDGLTPDPLLTFYRGVTYVFNVTSEHKLYFKTADTIDSSAQYTNGIIGSGTKNGQIIFTVDDTTPSVLYYGSDDNLVVGGKILIKAILENSVIDVENEIIGKVQYKSGNNIEFINGLKVRFVGNVTPSFYIEKDFIVEGVGHGIKLVEFSKLTSPDNLGTLYNTNFDATPFDEFSFDNFKNIPLIPEYVTINKASKDLNPWTRYNRWFHSDVIKTSAEVNGLSNPEYPQDKRASRPIIEFIPDMQLWNFGSTAIDSVDLIDNITTDVFSQVEQSVGYYVDEVKLDPGFKVVFNADKDPLVNGKIFEVSISIIDGKERLNLTEVATPVSGNGIVINNGTVYAGTGWWFNGSKWMLSQTRTVRNQAPLFDLFDKDGYSYSNPAYYNSEFYGNKIFGYVVGTGTADPVLGFPLKYYNNLGLEGTYLFNNYFGTESISIVSSTNITQIPTYTAYLKINTDVPEYINEWTPAEIYQIPVTQFQIVTTEVSQLEVTVFDNPGTISDLQIDLFVNDIKKSQSVDYTLVKSNSKLHVKFTKPLNGTETPVRVLLKCYSNTAPNITGVYETPLNLTNNALNAEITTITLSEISDHVKSMVDRDSSFVGVFPGISNLKSLPKITKYGARLISNNNPLSFAHCFITNAEHNVINSIRQVSTDYYQYRLNLIKIISQIGGQLSPADVLDAAMSTAVQNKNNTFPYGRSDMIGFGNNNITRRYVVTDSRNKNYSITSVFDNTVLSNRSVLVYLNNSLLTYGIDYTYEKYDSSVLISKTLVKGDEIVIKDYVSTDGSYIPPTPTKLGLYPKYVPSIFIDYTYIDEPVKIIQGHDGSLTRAYSNYDEADDFRDLALLEYEIRVYNNLKTSYDENLINIHDVLPGVFRTQYNSYSKIYDIVQGDFLKWASVYGIDFSKNSTYDINNHKTYNYKSATDSIFAKTIPGNWRGIYKYYFDTDRPNTHPWEMLGFSIKPTWWESEYGAAPYTSGNLNLWQDIETGMIRHGDRAGVDPTYVRTGLSSIIPVDEYGNVIDIREWAALAENDSIIDTDQDWVFGDHGPAETAWRRSSMWPFAVQIILALTKPADYAAMMFDTSRLKKDITGQYNYGTNEVFLNPKNVVLHDDVDSNGNLLSAAGYSVWIIECGKQRRLDYVSYLKQELASVDFNLFYKAAGFLSKDKLEVIIDSINPNSANPGVLLPSEDYKLHFNVSAPVKSAAISGIIIEKNNGKFVVKGYDKRFSYFTINTPIKKTVGSVVTVGGTSEAFLTWKINSFYQTGQIVSYNNLYYRVVKSHNSGSTFTSSNYAILSKLPIVGGVSVLGSTNFETEEILIPYGTKYETLQEVYDFIVGYGHWLATQGFIFDEFNKELSQVLNWEFTGKEFLYWSTQNWADGSVITLSPFANSIKYKFIDSTVDNVLNSFYEYSLLKADGQSYPKENVNLSREEGVCTISTKNTVDGLFFARLNLVQKEHAIVLNNASIFNDTIYDVDTGYRQSRIRLIGFRTADWNGDFLSPGFIYDDAQIDSWQQYTDYKVAEVVKYVGKYYSANKNIVGSTVFDFTEWTALGNKPIAQLFPNFDYKINQFEDFYSLDIDNFDAGQQKMAQHLIGYTPRTYLDNIFINPIAQYKFYQGFIKEKGTRNAIDKLAKASIHNLKGQIDFNEEWAFRVGSYGNYTSYKEIEFPLKEAEFIENSQIVKFVDVTPVTNDSLSYINPSEFTIKTDDYSSDTVFAVTNTNDDVILPVAGYVRADDVTATAYNKNSLLDIANNGSIKEGNTIWLGFREDGQWDVYRYTKLPTNVVASNILTPGSTIKFTTDKFHNLSVGDIVSVTGLDNSTDGVYIVQDIPSLTDFTANTTLVSTSVSNTSALLFTFASVRIENGNFDKIADLQQYIKFQDGDCVWIDNSEDLENWEVYKKTTNYQSVSVKNNGLTQSDQQFGYRISSPSDSNIVVVSAPNYFNDTDVARGRIFVYLYDEGSFEAITNYSPNSLETYYTGTNISNFGSALVYDTSTNAIFVGAPNASRVGENTYINEGFVKISSVDITQSFPTEEVFATMTNPSPTDNALFGASIFVSKSTSTSKLLLVGAPGQDTVYSYSLSITTSTTSITSTSTIVSTTGTLFGSVISGAADSSIFAISAPENNAGKVYVYTATNLTSPAQTISPPSVCEYGDKFGSAMVMSDDGSYLFVASSIAGTKAGQNGKVFVYKNNSNLYELIQTINNPTTSVDFGISLSIDQSNRTLVVTAQGTAVSSVLEFDNGLTTFDGETCDIVVQSKNSGSTFVFERNDELFVFAEELLATTLSDGSEYGETCIIKGTEILVGAPGNRGRIVTFDKIDSTVSSWELYRSKDDLVDISKIKKSMTVDSVNEIIVDYLDIIDPIKGRISGLADQEIRYKTAFDPAVYSIGVNNVVVDTETSWIEEHLGELWWDLSTVKYQWYEQGDIAYRKNVWGTLFPGASIDVYEWVSSEYLPSQWSAIADTAEGLMKGISGQPKYPDNSVISVKEYFNPTTGSTTNIYYFWVKNKVIIPDTNGRKLSGSEVAGLIYDPSSYGTKYISVIAPNAIVVTNVTSQLNSNKVYLNIATDDIDNDNNRHTEWLLLEENSELSMPNKLLDKKLLDSLLGKDSVGNPVPDPKLSERIRYGVGIRPRQTMFKDKAAALRNTFEYVNSVLSQNIITNFVDFTMLNSKDEIPPQDTGEYDLIVEDNEGLAFIVTGGLKTAAMTCTVLDGKISSVIITDPGYGYINPPTVEIIGDDSGAIIKTHINEAGEIIIAEIVNAGQRFVSAPVLVVRPYTVIVRTDSTINNVWSKRHYINKVWTVVYTQQYDTSKYWDYIDWISTDYDNLKPLSATVDQPYLLDTITLSIGDYVKVNNQGNGKYIVLQNVAGNGTFSNNFDLLYCEKGTIRFNESLWNKSNSSYNFDYLLTFDQSWFDQSPEIELANALHAIKNDIFVGSLKICWNNLFFKLVRYAMSEQKFLDWAFKTSFINVRNMAGELDQRPVYKFQNSQYYEDYINEIKPYHTKIRNFQVDYDVIEPTRSYTTDFDLAPIYDTETNMFVPMSLDNPLLNEYPRKAWTDNYKLTVESIKIMNRGSGYTSAPRVEIIAAAGDTGSGATAEAYISLGKVIEIEITNPGSGYTQVPTVLIVGGGPTDLTPATAYATMTNGKVRANKIDIKFDRISSRREIGNNQYSDSYFCNGNTFEFKLTWAAESKRSLVDIRVDGITVLAEDYQIINYTELFNGYYKKYSKIVLSYTPAIGQVLDVTYHKNIGLYNAVDRIDEFYAPTSGMPGVDPGQLLTGVDYPGVQLETLPLNYSANWDMLNFSESAWSANEPMAIVLSNPGSGYLPDYYNTLTTFTDISIIPTGNDTTASITVTATAVAFILHGKIDRLEFTNYGSGYTSAPQILIDPPSTGTTATAYITLSTNDPLEIDIDTIIDGGTFTNIVGYNPSDVILDGDSFVSPNVSHGPEELVPGQVLESVGISVYTRAPSGSPLVTQTMYTISSTASSTDVSLSMMPPNTGTLMVSFNNQILDYGTDYTVDITNKILTVSTQTTTGLLAITGVGIGGIGFISSDYTTVSNASKITVDAESLLADIGSVYVSLNGRTLTTSEYTLSTISSKNKRGRVTVTGINSGTNTLQAWFFAEDYKGYSEVKEERFYPDGSTSSFVLSQFPGTIGPAHANAVVELNGKRLTPPNSTYYSVANDQLFFDIDPNNEYPAGVFDLASLEVHVNGIRIRNGIDFILDQVNQLIEFRVGFLKTGDVLAITNIVYSDYYITGGKIYFPHIVFASGDMLKVITYTNHNGSQIRTEVFQARSSGRYPISRTIINDDYVWVSIAGNSLINGFDYYIDSDGKTVVVNENYPFDPAADVVIVSMTDIVDDAVLGYRIFKDILHRTHFKRLSSLNSTQLTAPLYTTSTEIHVENGSVLPIPNLLKQIPGVVLINGERIEYLTISNNVLGNLKRATLGTAARDYYPAGTTLVDQGRFQTIPFKETRKVYTTATTNAVSYSFGDLGLNPLTTATNQVEVYYGGVLLRKPTISSNTLTMHDSSIAFDSGEVNSLGISSDIVLEPQFTIAISGTNYTVNLNLDAITSGTNLVVVHTTATDWYDSNDSLINDRSIQANFLRDNPATLPDKYHYGQL
jgi:hypothetical protein